MHDAVIVTDRQAAVTFINPIAEVLTGWQQSEAMGQAVSSIFQRVDDVQGTPAVNLVVQVFQTGEVVSLRGESVLIGRDGRQIPIWGSVSPLKQPSGEITGAVIIFWDSRDRNQTEPITQVLTRKREFICFRSQFISTLFHEFSNPLSAILTAAQLLNRFQDRATHAQKQRYLQQIMASVGRMTALMDDLRTIGQAESGRLEFIPAPIDLEQFCRDLITKLFSQPKHFNRIAFTCQGDCTRASIDKELAGYILSHLLTNALNYSSDQDMVQFNLTCNPDESVAIFCIQDQGIGIPETEQARVFEPFYRAKNVGKVPGNGLGLAVVNVCVERHQGEISLTNTVGVGSIVTVKLPWE
ncbi:MULTISPECIES: sensor histidine kinase [unclassified Coleofasciculus]|uniref:sensor histidine kinase n=1 Tax=unclassified Coleofasciculus TaxID=2692782 RepID=UPI0019F50B52|nr:MULTISPECIES: HAMP domain-containing sensor histidine kinase [unclassified Coleofasciculus]MBE9150278.1 PAS domain-containing protein [Coleofasciculus sp. LEGE 07092]